MTRYDVIGQTINTVFHGPVSWTIYSDGILGSPVRSEYYAVVETMYEDGTLESFVSPLIPGRDGQMTWASYFDTIFVGVMHQIDKPTMQEIHNFTKDIEALDIEIREAFDGKMKEEEPVEPKVPGLIKFVPKKRPLDPDGDK